MKTMKDFFKVRETYLGIFAALAFPIIFFIIWLTAYDGVYERASQLEIALVNEDAVLGEEITRSLLDNDQLQVIVMEDLAAAKENMDVRDISMVIHIPATFSATITTEGAASIAYYVNQSTATLSKQIMEVAATRLTSEINAEIFEGSQAKLAESIPLLIAKEGEQVELSSQISRKTIELIQSHTNQYPVAAELIKTNNKDSFAATMIPLLVVLASYIGAMLLGQHLQFTEDKLITRYSRRSLFLTRQLINLGVAVLLASLIVGLLLLFKTDMEQGLLTLWGFQFLLFSSFLALSQIFVIAFKNPGMVVNIALVATQLVSSGAIVPRAMLSSFYQSVGSVLPGTYGVNGYFSMIFGGGDITADTISLLIITGVALLVTFIIVGISGMFSRDRKEV